MRLLQLNQRGELSLTKDLVSDIPPYAILSHTWGDNDDEVTFDDLVNDYGKSKTGYTKLQFCGNQARKDKIEYFWVDTCCINKANHAELSEAITSMFRWYRDAVKCYVYLSDVSTSAHDDSGENEQAWHSAFRISRWFTRGWTLQELLAPRCVEFFSQEEKLLGNKTTLEELIHEITDIPIAALHGNAMAGFPVDERLRWAAKRDTKKKEDKAYCLLGIFNVFMPLFYGEEDNAFIRLKEEINRRSGKKITASPSPSSTVPFRRDTDFVDRRTSLNSRTLLEQIQQQCAAPAARVALVGIGGAGKSQLAIEYCHRLRERSPDTWVFWIHASNIDRTEQGYREIAERVKIPGREDPKVNILELVVKWLQDKSKGTWLLVLDNLDDNTVLSTPQAPTSRVRSIDNEGQLRQGLSAYLPQSQNGTILITTRTRNAALKLVEQRDIIPINTMINTDALVLLQKKVDRSTNQQDLEELASLLEYMPLAIVQAAAYIQQKGTRYSVRQYIEAFQKNEKHQMNLLNYEAGHLRRDQEARSSVITTWQISFDDIREKWPLSADLLSLMSYFDGQGIPEAVLKVEAREEEIQDSMVQKGDSNHPDTQDEEDISETTSDDKFDEALDCLLSYSLVSIGKDKRTFVMHGLVQLATRKWLEMQGTQERWKAQFCMKLNAVFPNGEHENWGLCEILFPHAKSAERQRPEDLLVQDWAQILRKAAWYAWAKGDYHEAERMCEKSVGALRKALGEGEVETLYSLGLLASIYRNQGRWTEAEKIFIQVMETRKRVLGDEHPDTLSSMANLASTYRNQGRWKEAEKIEVQVMETSRRVLGDEHPSTLTSMANLASTLSNQGRWTEAEKMFVQVMETSRRVLGDEHPDTLVSMANLASTYWNQGRWTEAEKMFVQVMETRKRVLGDKHPDTLVSMANLASTYRNQGRWTEAEKMFVQVMETSRRVLGDEHPDTLSSMANLALTYWNQGRWTEAEKMEVQVMETRKRVLGDEHPDTLSSMANLASTYRNQGRWTEAEKINVQVMETRKRVLGDEHPNTLSSMANLASTYRNQGRWTEAEKMFVQVMETSRRVLGEEHPDTLTSMNNLATVLSDQGKYEQAEEMHRQALGLRETVLGKEHPDTLTSMKNLAGVLSNQGKYEQAEEMYRQELAMQRGDLTPRKHDDSWEEDLETLSDVSEVSSVESVPSLMSDASSASTRDKYGLKAAEHLATLLSEDVALTLMYENAVTRFGRERFHKNHDRLLKSFFKDLRSDAQNSIQLATVRSLRSRHQRHEITLLIHNEFEPPNIYRQQAMTLLRDQTPNRKQLLDDYLRERTSALQVGSRSGLEIPLVQSHVSSLEQEDESADEEVDSNSSDENHDQPKDQKSEETYAYLEPLEIFITRSNAFARFKASFGYLLHPPVNVSEALESRDLSVVQRFLARNFPSAATSEYQWLHELDEAGYSKREIAELLLEDFGDSPWIYFTPQVRVRHPIQTIFHVQGCAHQAEFNSKPQQLSGPERAYFPPPPLHTDVLRQVEELCGIGGVVPFTRDMSSWHGSVIFDEQSSGSMITYIAASAATQKSRNDLMRSLSHILANFCAAAAVVQSSGLCCDSFTVLILIQDCLELRRIEFHHAVKMKSYLDLAIQDENTEAVVQLCVQRAECILQELKVTITETTPDTDLHYCALAVQLLCTAFRSYIQAHVGPVDPFFLDTPQRKMVLLGNQHVPGDTAINAELVELTCLAEMTKQQVLAFSSEGTSRGLHLETGVSRYDVLSNAEDLLDTWGPGYFVHNKANSSKIHAVAVGGGFVSLVPDRIPNFHWAKGTLSEIISQATFSSNTLMRIGAAVTINKNCLTDEVAYRKSSFCALEPLGTHEIFWEPQERQAGFQGGQYLVGSYSQTWKKIPGTTLKQRNLQQSDWRLIYFLEQSWGLQVSLCTSVARRVSLRELVTDLLPMFVNPLEPDAWGELVNGHNIMQAFTQGDLIPWLLTLSLSLQRYVLSLVRTILEQLQHTGLDDRNTTLVIAWPHEGDVGRGLKIPCKAQTCWARVIADAEDCATFAYMTPKCLETNHVKCQGSLKAWQNTSKMLVTEMSPSRPEGRLVATANVAIANHPSPMTTAAMVTTQWELEDRKTYYIKKLNTLLRVKVERPSPASNDVAHLVVASTDVPRGFWKRLLLREEERNNHRIRERQASGDCAESVVVRAGLIRS